MFQKVSREIAFVLAGAACVLPSCTHGDYPGTNPANTSTAAARAEAIRSMGNGIYVFPATNFPLALKEFRDANPNLKITAMTQGVDRNQGEGTSSWGGADTFVVVTEAVQPPR